MTTTLRIATFHDVQELSRALQKALGEGRRSLVTVTEDAPITDPQRRRLFAMGQEIAKHLTAPSGRQYDAHGWLAMLLALMRGETMEHFDTQRVIVLERGSLSSMTKTEASELMTFVEAYGAERGVQWGNEP